MVSQLAKGCRHYSEGGEIAQSYYDQETTLQSDAGKGEGKTTEKMREQATYAGWDFANVWKMEANQYPKLQWQN